MPRYSGPSEFTPFAQVLVDYMWNWRSPYRPPMAVPELAARLGMPRQNVYNWIYRGTVPTFEIILAVLARLGIPLRALYDAYQRAGLTVPRWDERDTTPSVPDSHERPTISRSRKPTKAPMPDHPPMTIPEYERGPEPRPYIPPAISYNPEVEIHAAWERIAWQAEETLRAEGASEELIQRILTHLRQEQAGTVPTFSRYIQAEHTEPTSKPTSKPASRPTSEQPRQQPGRKSQRQSTAKANT